MTEMTKKVLSESLKKLLITKPINKITVKDVVNNSKLSRQTFYYHFQDIYELLDWTIKTELKELLKNNKSDNWKKTIVDLLHYIQKNEPMLPCVIESIGFERFEYIIYPDLYKFCKNVINELTADTVIINKYKNFLANFQAVSLIGMILQWTKNGMKDDPEEFVKLLHLTIYEATLNILEKYGDAS